MQQIHHKKNELQEVEFYKDAKCTDAFDFRNAETLYIVLKDSDITPLMFLYGKIEQCNLFIPLLPNTGQNEVYSLLNSVLHARGIKLYTLSNIENVSNRNAVIDNTSIFTITTNLSKYIPEDNAVLFLSEEDYNKYKDCFIKRYIENFTKRIGFLRDGRFDSIYATRPFIYDRDVDYGLKKPHPKTRDICWGMKQTNQLTIFLPHGTQSELQKANEVLKELREKYGVQEVNLLTKYWFAKEIYELKQNKNGSYTSFRKYDSINKIITTNSTGILNPEDSNERLQVIDCKEIFEECLKENN